MAVKKTIYLHIGTPKTGSKTIQNYLADHQDQLADDGYLVPRSSRFDRVNHMNLACYALQDDDVSDVRIRSRVTNKSRLNAFRRKLYRRLRREIARYRGDNVILSSEHCYERLITRKEKEMLKQLLSGLADQLRIIIYLREQSDAYCSQYSTSVVNSNTDPICSAEAFGKKPLLNYHARLLEWEEVFGFDNIILRIFDKSKFHGHDLITDFCYTIHAPRYDYRTEQLNPSLNAKQCEYLRIVNQYIPPFADRKINWIRKDIKRIVASTEITGPTVSALINQSYQAVYDPINQEVARRYQFEGNALFNKKPLNDVSIDQVSLLGRMEIEDITLQIIHRHHSEREVLCRCLSAIFDVPYFGEVISIDYVHSHAIDIKHRKPLRKRIADGVTSMRIWGYHCIKRLFGQKFIHAVKMICGRK